MKESRRKWKIYKFKVEINCHALKFQNDAVKVNNRFEIRLQIRKYESIRVEKITERKENSGNIRETNSVKNHGQEKKYKNIE